jgi:integrase
MPATKRTWKTPSGETRTAFVFRYYDSEGKYRAKQFKRERDARDFEAKTRVELKQGIHRPASTSSTVSEAAALWLDRCKGDGLEPGTVVNCEIECRLHIVPATVPEGTPNGWKGKFGDVKLSDLTSPMCDTFAIQLSKTATRSTAQRVLTRFKTLLKDAQRRGLIPYNPASPIQIRKNLRVIKVPKEIGKQIPSKDDVRAILGAAKGYWYPLFLTAAFTGMRASELRGLTWPHIDLDRRVIQVRQRVDRFRTIGPCKSVSGYRDIQIGDDVAEALRRWKLICPPGPLGFVFPNRVGNLINYNHIIFRGWFPLQHTNGMTLPSGRHKYKFHSLRHFFASLMIEQGTSPKRLQSLLGHATLSMTMDIYGHLFPPSEDETARINSAVASVLLAA